MKYIFRIIVIILNIRFLFFKENNFSNLSISKEKNFSISNNSLIKFQFLNVNKYISLKGKKIREDFEIQFYDKNNNSIIPSDLTLYHDIHIFCYFEIKGKNININSIPFIKSNKVYKCIEFFNIKEIINIGIKVIYLNQTNVFFFDEKEKGKRNESLFDFFYINQQFYKIHNKLTNKSLNLKLERDYFNFPLYIMKREASLEENYWYFSNLYGHYFCFCRGNNCSSIINYRKCKYLIYLYIIDNNRNVYPKTHFLFADFILSNYSSDDSYPIFKEMETKNFSVHYITENKYIYDKYCSKNSQNQKVILANKLNLTMDGDFLEKYLDLILKLKAVIVNSGKNFNYTKTNILYQIEYITYISITHGICYFKPHLYDGYNTYGHKILDKILIPPSKRIISLALRYGWKEENIIKLNLPKWDKYQIVENNKNQKEKRYSIFIFFTWRELKIKKLINFQYTKNILKLLNNKLLINECKKRKIDIFFSLHHGVQKYLKNNIKFNDNVIYIEENQIFEVISKASLIITDYSSIIFDFIFRRKPYIIYIPDLNDPDIENNYLIDSYNIISSFKNNLFHFENIFGNLDKAITKTIFYIQNEFKLNKRLINLYHELNLVQKNNTKEFINYLKNLSNPIE